MLHFTACLSDAFEEMFIRFIARVDNTTMSLSGFIARRQRPLFWRIFLDKTTISRPTFHYVAHAWHARGRSRHFPVVKLLHEFSYLGAPIAQTELQILCQLIYYHAATYATTLPLISLKVPAMPFHADNIKPFRHVGILEHSFHHYFH